MDKNNLNKAGLAAVILLAPGGLILGATLAARYWRKRNAEKAEAEEAAQEAGEDTASS